VQRHLDPAVAGRLADGAGAVRAVAGDAAPRGWRASGVRKSSSFLRERVVQVAGQTLELCAAFVAAARAGGDPFDLYRALRRFARIQEALYPVAPVVDAVSRWFLSPIAASTTRWSSACARGDADGDSRIGVLHADNERDERGGCRSTWPETWTGGAAAAGGALHGGHGHGRRFPLELAARRPLARRARAGADLARRTWSLMGEDVDGEPLLQNRRARGHALSGGSHADAGHRGCSTGHVRVRVGAREGTPFTHLALLLPASVHPMVVADGG